MKSNVQNSGIEFLGYQFCWDILRNKEFGFTREQSFLSHTKDGKTDRKFFLKKSENLCAIVFPNSSKVLFLETREEKKLEFLGILRILGYFQCYFCSYFCGY